MEYTQFLEGGWSASTCVTVRVGYRPCPRKAERIQAAADKQPSFGDYPYFFSGLPGRV